ncbi:MAG: hypothetical protein H6685_02065 [Deltaproteobacteria bacterium]|nr:hypothetical protein [Deltaproteobacteria bacterium]
MTTTHTQGYLIVDDLPWDCREYLRGSESVNDVVMFRESLEGVERRFAAFATDADLVVARVYDAEGEDHALAGYATLDGGFAKVAYAGGWLYAIPKSNSATIYRLSTESLSGGDSTPAGWAPWQPDQGRVYADIHGETIGDEDYLYVAMTIGVYDILGVMRLSDESVHSTVMGSTGDDAPGYFPCGQHDGRLYYVRGCRLYVLEFPASLTEDNFAFDYSFGYVGDDFAGTQVSGRNWRLARTGVMDVGFTQNDGLHFDTQVSGPGDAKATADFHAYGAGAFGAEVGYHVDMWPSPAGDQSCYFGLELISPDGQTRVSYWRYYDAELPPRTRLEVVVGGVLYDRSDQGGVVNDERIRVVRAADGGVSFAVRSSGQSAWFTVHNLNVPALVGVTLRPRLVVFTDTDDGDFSGVFEDFSAASDSADVYTELPDQNLAAVSVTAALAGDRRRIALAYTDRGFAIDVDESAPGAGGGTTHLIGPLVFEGSDESGAMPLLAGSELTSTCAFATSADVFFGGDEGVTQINIDESETPIVKRIYNADEGATQPLVWDDVRCMDGLAGAFAYGTATIEGEGYGYGYGQFDGGGAGYIIPTFGAPAGSDAWAEARHEAGIASIRVGAKSPDPAPPDYLHAHAERRVDGGVWHRLTDDGWTLYAAEGWDDEQDVAFWPDGSLGDMGLVVQDENLPDGRYEYRWIYQDAGGGQDALPCATLYQNDKEYLDTPAITAFVAESIDGSGTSDARGVTARLVADSGAATGHEAHRVWQVRFWNEGESEAASPWRGYRAAAAYPFTLSAGDGVKTVHARVRHVSGQMSEVASASVVLAEGAPAPEAPHENIVLCYGSAGETNFTGDDPSRMTATSEDPDFPATNVAHPDLGVVYRSADWGAASTIEFNGQIFYAHNVWLKWDLGLPTLVDTVAILRHNLSHMALLNEVAGASLGVFLYGSNTSDEFPVDDSQVFVPLSALTQERTIIHRPRTVRRYWALNFYLFIPQAAYTIMQSVLPSAYEIGRVVLSEAALTFQPPHNYHERVVRRMRDPSTVAMTQGQARRVVELSPYREVELLFADLTGDERAPFETIWERQRQLRPVFAILEPGVVSTGLDAPEAPDRPGALHAASIYGYLGESMQAEGVGYEHADVRLTITESQG